MPKLPFSDWKERYRRAKGGATGPIESASYPDQWQTAWFVIGSATGTSLGASTRRLRCMAAQEHGCSGTWRLRCMAA